MRILLFSEQLTTLNLRECSHQTPSSLSTNDTDHTIKATITDHAGQDITSSFEVRLFVDPSRPSNDTVATNSSHDDSLMGRREAYFSRQITYCLTPGSTFVSSECTPVDNKPGSLQSYTIACHRTFNMYHPYTGDFMHSQTMLVRRSGHCWHDEMCRDGYGHELVDRIGPKVANCIHKKHYRAVKAPIGLKLDKQSVLHELEGKRLSMVVSKADESTPLEVDTFDVKSLVATGGVVEDDILNKCRDCMGLETQQFKQGVDGLKAEATLLTSGAVAAASILWIALL